MPNEAFEISTVLPATPVRVYGAWLDARQHAALTDGAATCDAVVGGAFTAWDGYIQGTNRELVPHSRIVQSWRTTEFPATRPIQSSRSCSSRKAAAPRA